MADAVAGRYRALVLLGVFGSLRWGELAALRRSDIDFQARTVRVSRQLSEQVEREPHNLLFGERKGLSCCPGHVIRGIINV